MSPESNRKFDQVWMAQLVLQSRLFFKGTADGVLNEATKSALAAFQKRIERIATGAVDEELLRRVLDCIEGPMGVTARVTRDVLPRHDQQLGEMSPGRAFSAAINRLPEQSFSQYFDSLAGPDQTTALTTYIMTRGAGCSFPF